MDSLLQLLEEMVRIPSFSRQENEVADMLESWLIRNGLTPHRAGNNLWLESGENSADLPMDLVPMTTAHRWSHSLPPTLN